MNAQNAESKRDDEYLTTKRSALSSFEKWKNTSPGFAGGGLMLVASGLGLVALIVTLIQGLTSDYDNCINKPNDYEPNPYAEPNATLQIESANTFKIANCTGLSDTVSTSQTNDVLRIALAIGVLTLVTTAAIYAASKALGCYKDSIRSTENGRSATSFRDNYGAIDKSSESALTIQK